PGDEGGSAGLPAQAAMAKLERTDRSRNLELDTAAKTAPVYHVLPLKSGRTELNAVQPVALSNLDFGRNLWIHQRCAAIRVNHLSRDPAGFVRTEKSNDTSDVLGCCATPHRSATGGVRIA